MTASAFLSSKTRLSGLHPVSVIGTDRMDNKSCWSATAPVVVVCHLIGYRAAQWRLSKQHINVGRGTIDATMNEIDIGLS